MYTAMDLSKYIVSKCVKDNHFISNLQLQKILYYIQKDYLGRNSLAFADNIEAWQFGPVVPNVYYYYCGSGAMPIFFSCERGGEIEECDRKRIDPIVESKRVLDPWDLVKDTHRPEGAWAQIFRDGSGNRQVIPTELIKAAG